MKTELSVEVRTLLTDMKGNYWHATTDMRGRGIAATEYVELVKDFLSTYEEFVFSTTVLTVEKFDILVKKLEYDFKTLKLIDEMHHVSRTDMDWVVETFLEGYALRSGL